MQLGQAQLGYPTNIHLGGYIPAPVQRDSVAKQALLAFLANAGGALAHQAVGAGAEALGALTPEQTAQQAQMGETARHNVAGEQLGQQELSVRSKFSNAEIQNMRDKFGLSQETERGQLALGQRHAATAESGQAETGRHNLTTEGESAAKLAQDKALIDATVGHLGAETGQLKSTTSMQQNMQRQMAIANLTRGMDPKSPQTLMLVQAANGVPFTGDEQTFSTQVQQKMQDMAKQRLGGSAGAPSAQTAQSNPIGEYFTSGGLGRLPEQVESGLANVPGNIAGGVDDVAGVFNLLAGGPERLQQGMAEREQQKLALLNFLGKTIGGQKAPISAAPPYQIPTIPTQ